MNPVDFKDLPGLVGQEVGVSDWLLVDQDRVNKFADATGDHQWIHVDVERATREIGGPIAHGYLTLSLIPFLGQGMLPVKGVTRGINYGSDKVRFTNMVRADQLLAQAHEADRRRAQVRRHAAEEPVHHRDRGRGEARLHRRDHLRGLRRLMRCPCAGRSTIWT